MEEKRKDRHDQHEEKQRGRRARGGNAQPLIEPALADHLSKPPKQAKRDSEHEDDALQDMMQLVMAEFVRKDCLNLGRREARKQRIGIPLLQALARSFLVGLQRI